MKNKTLWLGNCSITFIDIFSQKPKHWEKTTRGWMGKEIAYLSRDDSKRVFKGTGVSLPRKNSKQLIPFHIVPAKGK